MAFRFLGLVAALDRKFSGNLLELHAVRLLLLSVLVIGAVWGVRHLTSARPSEYPRNVSIADLASGKVPVGSYVVVRGTVDSGYRIAVTTRHWSFERRRLRSTLSTSEMVALVDDLGRTGLLISPVTPASWGHQLSLTGTVAQLPNSARDTLTRDEKGLTTRLHPELMLALGRSTPASTEFHVALVAVCGPLAALFLYVRLKRGLVFRARPMGDAALEHGDVRGIDVRLTGRLRLGTGAARHFLEMPAQATINDRGEVVLDSTRHAP